MKRFIDLRDQILEGELEFAFYDTITDTFETFDEAQTWRSMLEFMLDYDGEELERYLILIPKRYRNGT